MVSSKDGYDRLLEKQEKERNKYTNQVKWVQQRLVAHGFILEADGIYGKHTKTMVEEFQLKNDIAPTGEVATGDYTYNLLKRQPVEPEVSEQPEKPEEPNLSDDYITEHFKASEFACRANGELPPEGWDAQDIGRLGAAPTEISLELCQRLEKLRAKLGRPISITSGYRTPDYNRKVGGASRSQHLYGRAADITVAGVLPAEVANQAEDLFKDGGLGRYSTFTHVDVRGYYARW